MGATNSCCAGRPHPPAHERRLQAAQARTGASANVPEAPPGFMHVLVHPPPGIRPGMAFHIEVPPARRVGDRVEARVSADPRPGFSSGRIAAVRDGGASFMINWDTPAGSSDVVRAADVRDHPDAPRHDQPRARFAVTCPPGCAHPSSFVARVPAPASTQPSPAPVPAGGGAQRMNGVSRFSRAPSVGRLVAEDSDLWLDPRLDAEDSDLPGPRLAGGGTRGNASLFTATSSEFSTADPFTTHQQALQKVINDTIRHPRREHARLAALRAYNESGRRCLSHKSVTGRPASVHTFAAGGQPLAEVCTCEELCHLTLRREHLVEDAYLQLLHENTPKSLRRQLIVKYEGEDGIDEGGLSKSICQVVE